jgi:hypothetical protein
MESFSLSSQSARKATNAAKIGSEDGTHEAALGQSAT